MTDRDAVHVLVVAHGPPLRGDRHRRSDLVEDPGLNDMSSTSSSSTPPRTTGPGRFSLGERPGVSRDAVDTFRRSCPGTVVHTPLGALPGSGRVATQVAVAVASACGARRGDQPSQPRPRRPWRGAGASGSVGSERGLPCSTVLAEATVLTAAAGMPNILALMPTPSPPGGPQPDRRRRGRALTAVHEPPVGPVHRERSSGNVWSSCSTPPTCWRNGAGGRRRPASCGSSATTFGSDLPGRDGRPGPGLRFGDAPTGLLERARCTATLEVGPARLPYLHRGPAVHGDRVARIGVPAYGHRHPGDREYDRGT